MKAPLKNFVALILTHGRAENVVTYKTLRKRGYTGPIRLVVDDEDEQYEKYCELYPDEVVRFHKAGVKCDTFDNRKERRVILFARNVAFDIASELGYEYFIELDDDYESFSFRFDLNGEYRETQTYMLDEVFAAMVEFMQVCPNVATLAMAQGGDFVGGGKSNRASGIKLWRKAMNSFVCSTKRRFQFRGRINEDVNTYAMLGSKGVLFFTHNMICLHQKQTQSSAGGMTGAYIDGGTYIKSFYTIIAMPSACKVGMMGNKNVRLHHKVDWNLCAPKIVSEELRNLQERPQMINE